jgi:hypothetical protein
MFPKIFYGAQFFLIEVMMQKTKYLNPSFLELTLQSIEALVSTLSTQKNVLNLSCNQTTTLKSRSFPWKRALGVAKAKRRVSKATGI